MDVIIFMLTLLIANYFWKFTMNGDEKGDMVTWFGMDITAPFEFMACHIASVVFWLLSLCRDTVHMIGDHVIRFDSGSGTSIIWGCSGLKQAFIWFFLILTVRSGKGAPAYVTWLHKLWYIPVGWLCCYAFNILRIFLISLFIEFHPDWFPVLHDYIFKYAFYGMLFLLWVIFVEKIRPGASFR
jgi:exosortase/archaeosortase family protein